MSELKSDYLETKRNVIFTNSKFLDFLLFLGLWMFLSKFLFSSLDRVEIPSEDDPLLYNQIAAQAIIEAIGIEVSFLSLWIAAVIANILFVVALRGTLGMKALGISLSREGGRRPTFLQSAKFVLLSPLTFSINLYMVFMVFSGIEPDLYILVNAKIVLLFGTYALLTAIYTWKFGTPIRRMEHIAGLNIHLSSKKLAKLEKQFDKKGKTALYLTEKSIKIGHTLYRTSIVIMCVAVFYMSSLVILDLFKKLEFEEKLYAPYAINWGKDNGYFALEGLVEPADVKDFYEAGRSTTYHNFVRNEALKKKAKISYSFDVPPKQDFAVADQKSKPLEFKFVWDEKSRKNFECISSMRDDLNKENCSSVKELEETIVANKTLLDRFNQLPQYAEFQQPPINIQGRPYGSALISLARLKSAQIIMMQERGQPDEALKEWARFMQAYRKMTEVKTTIVAKAIYMIVLNVHHKTLEKMLYLDPELAITHFDLIKDSLNPQGVAMFRGNTMLMDDLSNLESFVPSMGTGYAPGIRNKFYHCFVKIDARADLSPKQYFANDHKISCTNGGLAYGLFDFWFLTTGNFVTNSIYGLAYGGVIKGQELVRNMHVSDTYLRMELLGTKTLHDKIPADKVADYIQKAPVELQNPITEKPFEWDEKGRYLYFSTPNDPNYLQKFHLNIK